MAEIAGFILFPISHIELDSKPVLRAATQAHRALAELKGKAGQLPNPSLLVDTLILREAKVSSEIENIVTTQDELYKTEIFGRSKNLAAKEVHQYADALRFGYQAVRKESILRISLIEEIQEYPSEQPRPSAPPGTR